MLKVREFTVAFLWGVTIASVLDMWHPWSSWGAMWFYVAASWVFWIAVDLLWWGEKR